MAAKRRAGSVSDEIPVLSPYNDEQYCLHPLEEMPVLQPSAREDEDLSRAQTGHGKSSTESDESDRTSQENAAKSDEVAEQYYNILSHADQYIKQLRVKGKTVCFEFKNLEKAQKPHDVVVNVFQALIDEALSVSDGNKFGVSIDAPDMNKCFLIPFRPVEQNNPASIVAEFDRLIQSNEKLSLTDSKWTIKITTFKAPEGSCNISRDKKLTPQVVQIINPQDAFCLARAIAVGLSYYCNSDEFQKIKAPRSRLQLIKAKNLLRLSELDPLKTAYNIDDVHKIQVVLNTKYRDKFRIVVFQKEIMNRIVYKGDKHAEIDLCLYMVNNHFHFLKSPNVLFGGSFCIECETVYPSKIQHARNCKRICPRCRNYNKDCKDPNFQPIKCESCHIIFLSNSCYEEHKRSINAHSGKSKKTICSQYYRCTDCGKLVVLANLHGQPHVCDDKYCTTCHIFHAERTPCFISTQKLEAQRDYRFVWFDLETTQNDKVTENVFRHKVNFAVAQSMCTRCIDSGVAFDPTHISNCKLCGPQCQLVSSALIGEDPLKELLRFITDGSKNIVTKVFSHYGGKFDLHLLLAYLCDLGTFVPKIFARGQKIYKMVLKSGKGKIEFLDSYNFLNTALANLPKLFNLQTPQKLFFPHYFNRPENYDVDLPHLPPIEYYGVDHMMSEQKSKFLDWYERNKNTTPFSLKKDLVEYTVTDVDLLREATVCFRELYLSISKIDPYLKSCTIAGVCMNIYRTHFLPPETIGIMPENGYNREQRQSVLALKYLSFEAQKTGHYIRHRNCGEGEFKILRPEGGFIRVDGYVAAENIVYEILGCYYHGCPYCHPNGREKIAAHGKTVEENYQLWLERLMFLKSKNFVVHYIWECEIKLMLKKDKEMKRFFDEVEIIDPISIRKDGYFGGRTQPSMLYYKIKEGEEIKGFDIVSLYPSQMRDKPLPIDHPRVLRGDDVSCTLPWKLPSDCIYKGSIKCRVLPPTNLLEPVLPYRTSTGRLLFPLCAKCGEMAQKLEAVEILECRHSELQRSWVHAFCHPELLEALNRGYKVLKIYEVWEYKNFSTSLFTDYVDRFIKLKVESSGFPSSAVTEPEKAAFIKKYEHEQGIKIDINKVSKNPGLRHIAKLSLNSLYGKFAQSNNMSDVLFISNYQELARLFNDHRYVIQEIIPVNDKLVRVTRCKKENFVIESDISNIAIASFITSYSRLRLYEYLKLVEGRVIYVDTDSCYYVSRKGMPDITDSSLLGEMSQEYKEFFIDEMVAAGAKQYGLHMRHRETGEEKTVLKIRGFTLDSASKTLLSYETLKNTLFEKYGPSKAADGIVLKFPQIKRSKLNEIHTVLTKKKYTAVYGKGIVLPNFETRPFGFTIS